MFIKSNGQADEQILVKFNDGSILKSEFQYRLDFSPKEGMQDRTKSGGIKKELLYTMIAEKLWELEAIDKGYENYPPVITAKNVMEKMFVRDALYKKEIKDKVNLTPEEIENGLNIYSNIFTVTVFFSQDKKEIINIYSQLNNNTNISVIVSKLDTLKVTQKNTPVTFGDLDQLTENFVFNLKPDQYTAPLQIRNGWSLFYLHKIAPKKDNEFNSREDKYKKVVKILKERQEESNYDLFYKKFFENVKVNIDGKLFDKLAKKLHEIFLDKENNKLLSVDENGNKRFLLDSYDVRKIEKEIDADALSKSFIEFEKDAIDLKTFVREISFSSFSVPSADLDSITNYLNKKTKDYIKYELLAREGYKQGLDDLPEVKRWVDIWYKSFLYQSIRNDFFASEKNNLNSGLKDENQKDKAAFEKFIDSTIELAYKYKFQINEDSFSKIKQGNINLYVVRYLGFGGSVAGVPTSYPFIEWFLEMQKRRKENVDNIL